MEADGAKRIHLDLYSIGIVTRCGIHSDGYWCIPPQPLNPTKTPATFQRPHCISHHPSSTSATPTCPVNLPNLSKNSVNTRRLLISPPIQTRHLAVRFPAVAPPSPVVAHSFPPGPASVDPPPRRDSIHTEKNVERKLLEGSRRLVARFNNVRYLGCE